MECFKSKQPRADIMTPWYGLYPSRLWPVWPFDQVKNGPALGPVFESSAPKLNKNHGGRTGYPQ